MHLCVGSGGGARGSNLITVWPMVVLQPGLHMACLQVFLGREFSYVNECSVGLCFNFPSVRGHVLRLLASIDILAPCIFLFFYFFL